MRLDVVGVPVEAVRVVGDQDLRAYLPDDPDQQPGRLVEVGAPERPRVVVGRQAHHAGVPVPPGAAEEPLVGHAECGAGGGQLADAVPAELVGMGGFELGQLGDVDLPLLAQRAGDEGDVCAGRGVPGHRRAGADRLVVRVRVDEQDPASWEGHADTLYAARGGPFGRVRGGGAAS